MVHDIKTRDTGLRVHITDLPTEKLAGEIIVVFTFYWLRDDRREGTDFGVAV